MHLNSASKATPAMGACCTRPATLDGNGTHTQGYVLPTHHTHKLNQYYAGQPQSGDGPAPLPQQAYPPPAFSGGNDGPDGAPPPSGAAPFPLMPPSSAAHPAPPPGALCCTSACCYLVGSSFSECLGMRMGCGAHLLLQQSVGSVRVTCRNSLRHPAATPRLSSSHTSKTPSLPSLPSLPQQ